MKSRVLIGGIVAAAVVITSAMVARSATARPPTWAADSAQVQVATRVAQNMAARRMPAGSSAAPAGAWSSNVESFSVVASTRQQALAYLDAAGGFDDQDVLVIQLTGKFQTNVNAFGPDSPTSFIATSVTEIIDPVTGAVLDGASIPAGGAPMPAVPSMATIYKAADPT